MESIWFKILTFLVPIVTGFISAALTAKDAKRLRDELGDKSIITKIMSGRAFTQRRDKPKRKAVPTPN